MKNFWVTFANTDFDSKRLKEPKLEYPLAMHVPFFAFNFDNAISVSKKTDKFEIGIELAIKLKDDIFQLEKQDALNAIESYHVVISVTNKYHINGIKDRVVLQSDQDESDSEYFTRWWENSNSISGVIDCCWEELQGKDIKLAGLNFNKSDTISYYHKPEDIIHFVSNINKLYKGTYICLGHILRHEISIDKADGMIVECIIPSITEHKVTLCTID